MARDFSSSNEKPILVYRKPYSSRPSAKQSPENPTWINKISECCHKLKKLSLNDTPSSTLRSTTMFSSYPPISRPSSKAVVLKSQPSPLCSVPECTRDLGKLSLLDEDLDFEDVDKPTAVTEGKKSWSFDHPIFAKYTNPLSWFNNSNKSLSPALCPAESSANLNLNTQLQTYYYNNDNLSMKTTLTSSSWGNNPFYITKTATAQVYYKNPLSAGPDCIIPSKSMFGVNFNNGNDQNPKTSMRKLGAIEYENEPKPYQSPEPDEQMKKEKKPRKTWIKFLIGLSIILNLLFIIGLSFNYLYVSNKFLDLNDQITNVHVYVPSLPSLNFRNLNFSKLFSGRNVTRAIKMDSPLDLTYDLVGQII